MKSVSQCFMSFKGGVLLLLLLLLSGCMSSNRYVIIDPSTAALRNYSVLEVRDFRSNLSEPEAIALAGEFPSMIVSGINDYNARHSDARLFSEVTRMKPGTYRVLVMESTLLSYEKGSRAARYFIGFGAGKAYCTIQSVFIDKTTGKQVLKANFEGELGGGFFGGTSKQAAREVVDSIITYLKKNY